MAKKRKAAAIGKLGGFSDVVALWPLLPVVSNHASLIQSRSNKAPEVEEFAQALHGHIEIIQARITAVLALIAVHRETIDKIIKWTPEIQDLITEALPVIVQISPPSVTAIKRKGKLNVLVLKTRSRNRRAGRARSR